MRISAIDDQRHTPKDPKDNPEPDRSPEDEKPDKHVDPKKYL